MSYSIQQRTDGLLHVVNPADAVTDLMIGGPAAPTASAPRWIVPRVVKMALGVADTAGGVLSWQTPADFAIIIDRVVIDITTKATGACTIDIGTTATNGTTSSDNLLDGKDVGTAVGTFDNILAADAGTNGKTKQKAAASTWVTASKASGAAAGLVGYAYITYYPAT